MASLEACFFASQLSREDYSCEGERVVEKASVDKSKGVLVGLTKELFDFAFGAQTSNQDEEYVPMHVEP